MSEENTAVLPAAPFGMVVKKFLHPLTYFSSLNGRARRGEYWTAALLVMLPSFTFTAIAAAISVLCRSVALYVVLSLPMSVLGLFMIPVTIRRWHDLGVTGWLIVVCLGATGFPCSAIPILGPILGFLVSVAWLVFFCLPGRKGDNAYGADPRDPAAVDPPGCRKEPWLPLILVTFAMTLTSWAWSIYTIYQQINALHRMEMLNSLYF
jgi:uncharacterized membrane protein YhaH (DUF805 family)